MTRGGLIVSAAGSLLLWLAIFGCAYVALAVLP